jgi:undecaprenyl diphosphate synthase
VRHSGFLLYDSAYSEYYFTDKKWPEFDEAELDKVIESFQDSKRNF